MTPVTASPQLLCALSLGPARDHLLVRTVTAEKGQAGEQVILTGHINAEKETALAFRNHRKVGTLRQRGRCDGSSLLAGEAPARIQAA